jgi:hypothetical protein
LIILGVILLIIGLVAGIAIIWTIGIIAVVIGVILALFGMAGHAVGGRRHYFWPQADSWPGGGPVAARPDLAGLAQRAPLRSRLRAARSPARPALVTSVGPH